LAAAADLVVRKGFHAVAIAQIGAAAGITGSGVYRHEQCCRVKGRAISLVRVIAVSV